jgi:hypothetical protein
MSKVGPVRAQVPVDGLVFVGKGRKMKCAVPPYIWTKIAPPWCLLRPRDVTIPKAFPTNFFDERFRFLHAYGEELIDAEAGSPRGIFFADGPEMPALTTQNPTPDTDPVPVSPVLSFFEAPCANDLITGALIAPAGLTEQLTIPAFVCVKDSAARDATQAVNVTCANGTAPVDALDNWTLDIRNVTGLDDPTTLLSCGTMLRAAFSFAGAAQVTIAYK